MATQSVIQIPAGTTLQQTPNGEFVLVANPGPQTTGTTLVAPQQQQQQAAVRKRRTIGALVDEKKPVQVTLVTTAVEPQAQQVVALQPALKRFTAHSIMEPDEREVLEITSSKKGEFAHTFKVFHLDMQASYKDGEMVYDTVNIDAFNHDKSWLFYVQNHESYKLPCPWPLIMFTDEPHSMDILFPLSNAHSRIGDVMDLKRTELLRTVSLKELAGMDSSIDATRHDAHMLIYDATLKGYTTDGIDVPLNAHLYSWLDNGSANGVLRPLKHTVGKKLLVPSHDGHQLHAQCVMLPNTRSAFLNAIDDESAHSYHRRLYEMPDKVFDDPWVSRGLHVNFDAVRAELDKPASEGGYSSPHAGFLKVKGPPPPPQSDNDIVDHQHVLAVMRSLNFVQWLILNQFEYVLQETEEELSKLPEEHKLYGASVVQHNQAQTEWYFYVSKRALLELLHDWEKRVRQAHVLSNCKLLALSAIPLDHKDVSAAHATKTALIERERDRIDANPFISCWAKVNIRYWPFRGDVVSKPHVSKFSEDERAHMIAVVPSMSGIGATQAAAAAAAEAVSRA